MSRGFSFAPAQLEAIPSPPVTHVRYRGVRPVRNTRWGLRRFRDIACLAAGVS